MTRREEILDVAEQILEAEGPEALTMRGIAARLKMQAPSLYKHVSGKDDIEAGLQERALIGLGHGLAGANDLSEVAAAYRRWAMAHPKLYELATRRPLKRDEIDPQAESAAVAPILAAVAGDHNLARGLWALAHGMVDLELAGRFPPGADLDETWRAVLAVVAAGSIDAKNGHGGSALAAGGQGTPGGGSF